MSVSGVVGQFAYFDTQLDHPHWRGKRVLDFGGNAGNLLRHASPDLDPSNYWSIDLSLDGIEEGRRRHPGANFVFYDRYNPQYNPSGKQGLPIPDVGVRFDIIVGYSVVNHLSQTELLQLVVELEALAADGGVIALSFVDPNWSIPEGWNEVFESGMTTLERRVRQVNPSPDTANALLARARDTARTTGLTWVTVSDIEDLRLGPEDHAWLEQQQSKRTNRIIRWRDAAPHEQTLYSTFCTSEYMRQLLPHAYIRPPVRPFIHHCAVIPAGSTGLRWRRSMICTGSRLPS
ncbi:MAG: class I SAM-dependent methyltransferase [Natronosporangium sp.]